MATKTQVIKPLERKVVSALDVDASGKRLVVGQNGLSIWSLAPVKKLQEFKNSAGASVLMARWTADGRQVAFTDTELRLRLYDVEQQEALPVKLTDKKVEWVDCARKAPRLLAAGSRTQVWDVEAGEVVWALPGDGKRRKHPAIGCLSPDGKTAAVVGAVPERVVLYDVDSGRELQQFEGAPASGRWLQFDPKMRYLACTEVHSNGTFIWNVKTGKRQLASLFDQEAEGYWCFRFDPQGTRLALGMLLGRLYVHDLKSGDTQFKAHEHKGRIWDVAFTPDGKSLISGGDDYTARIWKLP